MLNLHKRKLIVNRRGIGNERRMEKKTKMWKKIEWIEKGGKKIILENRFK